jgi:hypothetical protein
VRLVVVMTQTQWLMVYMKLAISPITDHEQQRYVSGLVGLYISKGLNINDSVGN